MTPRISVIIPNYNHANHLQDRIHTVLQQTYPPFEVILLDDCSTDDSSAVLKQFQNHPLVTRLILNEKNSGNPFQQWKRGLAVASGDWIWIAESDDYADLTFLEKMTAAIQRHPSVGMVYSDSRILAGDVPQGNFADLKNVRFNTTRWSSPYFNAGQDEMEDYMLPGGTINNTSAVLFNADVLRRANPFDIVFRYIGDKYAFVRMLALADVAYVPEVLNFYRDPFNTKHHDKHIFYFYEQFLVFNWVYQNVRLKNRKKFFESFFMNTENSLLRQWGAVKFKLYGKLLKQTPELLFRNILYNLARSFGILLGRNKT